MTKFEMMQSLCSPASAPITITIDGHEGKVVELGNEDGSGSSFVVFLQDVFYRETYNTTRCYVRTTD